MATSILSIPSTALAKKNCYSSAIGAEATEKNKWAARKEAKRLWKVNDLKSGAAPSYTKWWRAKDKEVTCNKRNRTGTRACAYVGKPCSKK